MALMGWIARQGLGDGERPAECLTSQALGGTPGANLLSARGGASASCCMQSPRGPERDGAGGTSYTTGVGPRARTVRAPLRKGIRRKDKEQERSVIDQTAGTRRWSLPAVVWSVASRHRSMASRRAAATASLRRAAPLAVPSTSRRTGG